VLRDQGCKRASGIKSRLVIMFETFKFCVQLVFCRTNSVMGKDCFLKDKVLCVRVLLWVGAAPKLMLFV